MHRLPETLTIHATTLPVKIKHPPRARRITLRYDPAQQAVLLTMPKRTPTRVVSAFLQEKRGWIATQMQRYPNPVPFAEGATIPILGKPHTLQRINATRGSVRQDAGALHIPSLPEHFPRRTEDWLKAHLRGFILHEATVMAQMLGVSFHRITLRDTSSRWGSCSRDRNLSFCWRLVFAPDTIIRYVIAHEVAHLREMNHSPAFWRQVERLYPDYTHARNWLRTHSNELLRYGRSPLHSGQPAI